MQAAAKQIEKLLKSDPLAVRKEVKKLNEALAFGDIQKSTPQLRAAKAEIKRCAPNIRTIIMAGCHYFDRGWSKSLWRHFLRYQSGRDTPVSIESVVLHWEPALRKSEERAEALQFMLIHLSWLAPAWPIMSKSEPNPHGKLLDTALQTMIKILDREYEDLKSQDTTKRAFIADVKAALVPSCCSLLLRSTTANRANVPPWLQQELQDALPIIAAGSASAMFPLDANHLPANILETRHRATCSYKANTR